MWTDIYPLCCEFSGALHFCFRLLLLEDEFPLTLRFFRRSIFWGPLIFRWLDGERLRYEVLRRKVGVSFRVLPKRTVQVTVPELQLTDGTWLLLLQKLQGKVESYSGILKDRDTLKDRIAGAINSLNEH